MPNWRSLFEPLTDAPTRIAKKISSAVDPYEPMQQTGEGGLKDWLAWTDASAKGLLQGSGEAAGSVISDMTSPFSIGMSALGGSGLKRLAGLTRLAKNANRVAKEAPAIESAVSRLPAEFTPIGSESAANTARAARISQEAKDISSVAKKGNVGKTSGSPIKKDIAPEDWGDWGGAEKSMPTLGLDETGSTVANKIGIGASRPEEFIASASKKLPQIEDAYVQGTPNAAGLNLGSKGTSVYKPEVSKEMSRLMVEMLDEGATKDAFKIAQSKYPRLMGHVNEINIGPKQGATFFERLKSAGSSGGIDSGLEGANNLSTIRVDPISRLNWSPESMADTVGHELAHSAQRLRKGNTQFNLQYKAADKALGYSGNPLETMARKSGKKFSKYAMREE